MAGPHRRNIAVHGNRFIAMLVLSRIPAALMKEWGDDVLKSVATETKLLLALVEKAVEELYPEAMISRLFYNVTKCRRIHERVVQDAVPL